MRNGIGTLLDMADSRPINQTLLALLDNQIARTNAALKDLREDVFDALPGGDCKSIRQIGEHLLMLRRFQLSLLESSLATEAPQLESSDKIDDLRTKLDNAAELLGSALAEHDPTDWHLIPEQPREGKWGDEPTLLRFVRPFNDFVNHLGSIRAIRRILENPIDRTQ